MAWTLGGVNITVEEDSGDIVTPRIDLVDPIGAISTTYAHYAGTEAPKRDLQVVLWENYETEFANLINGSGYALISDQGAQGNYVILNAKPKRLQDLSRTAPVMRLDIELLKVS